MFVSFSTEGKLWCLGACCGSSTNQDIGGHLALDASAREGWITMSDEAFQNSTASVLALGSGTFNINLRSEIK